MLLLATDLDGTFLGGSLRDRDCLYRLLRNLGGEAKLVFVTGRALENVKPLLADPAIPRPDYIIADVGATIVDGRTLAPLEPIDGELAARWAGEERIVRAIPEDLPLERQQQAQERRCSFYTDDAEVVEAVRAAVSPLGCAVLHSANRYLDVLPIGVSKGDTLARLVGLLGVAREDVLVAGDSLNDLSMFTETSFRGVVVGGSEPSLRHGTARRDDTIHARRHGAGGILEAIEAWRLVEEASPKSAPRGDAELVLVYHRQPFDEAIDDDGVARRVPGTPNGIIPTLLGLFRDGRKGAWVAWSKAATGANAPKFERRVKLADGEFKNLTVSRLPLTAEDVDLFYQKFSKEALWPIIHSFIERASFDHRLWQHFVDINERFARQAAAEAKAGALVWIHDYNLWLVPSFLRRIRPDLRLAFFHHTPFPASDIFNVIPWSGEIIASLLKCDYVGFHVPRYSENFVDAARSHFALTVKRRRCDDRFIASGNALSVDEVTHEVECQGRVVRLGVHPVGLDFERIQRSLAAPGVRRTIERLREELAGKKVVVCAERLDYMKGPLQKLKAFERFLSLYPAWREKITFIDICTPPAEGMTIYDDVRSEVERAVGRINGRFATATWTPLAFMFRHVSFAELAAYLAVADVAWITPLRDGLNLVAKEYVAVHRELERAGVLIISEFAGSSVELLGALPTNPYDVAEMANTLQQALTMDPTETRDRMRRLGRVVKDYDVEYWARDFIDCAAGGVV